MLKMVRMHVYSNIIIGADIVIGHGIQTIASFLSFTGSLIICSYWIGAWSYGLHKKNNDNGPIGILVVLSTVLIYMLFHCMINLMIPVALIGLFKPGFLN